MNSRTVPCDQPFCVHGFIYGPGGVLCERCNGIGRILITEKPATRFAYRFAAWLIVLFVATLIGLWLGSR